MEHLPRRSARRRRRGPRAALEPCLSGVSGALFVVMFTCTQVCMYCMEGPTLYLHAIYALYCLTLTVFVAHILLDLALWDGVRSGSSKIRKFISRLCPVLCLAFSLPPAALLWHTKHSGGFDTVKSEVSLLFSLLLVVVEALHLILTLYVYRSRRGKAEDAVRFTYADNASLGAPSPASSIRSGRIQFVGDRTRNSLASIDSCLVGEYGNVQSQRATALGANQRFWEQQMAATTSSSRNSSQTKRHERRGSDSSVISGLSMSSRGSGYSMASGRSGLSALSISKDDTHSIVSKGSSRSRRRREKYGGYRVEEEMAYDPRAFNMALTHK